MTQDEGVAMQIDMTSGILYIPLTQSGLHGYRTGRICVLKHPLLGSRMAALSSGPSQTWVGPGKGSLRSGTRLPSHTAASDTKEGQPLN